MSYLSGSAAKKQPVKRDAMLDSILGKQPTKSLPTSVCALISTDDFKSYEFAMHEDFVHVVRREISALEAPENNIRKRAAEKLEHILVILVDQNHELREKALQAGQSCVACIPGVPSPQTVSEIFQEIHKPLLKRLADPVERIRDAAARILIRLTNSVPRADTLLPFIIPILVFRYSPVSKEQLEASEEVRLQVGSF